MVAAVIKAFGPLDILVNNARQLGVKKKFLDLAWADYETQLDVIVKGAFHCSQAALPSMIGRGGRIINMLSTVIEEPNWRWHTYGTAKGALWQMTRHLAAEMGPHNITVNMVSPGQLDNSVDLPPPAEIGLTVPLGRAGALPDVAQAVGYLLDAAYVTGANIDVAGGYRL